MSTNGDESKVLLYGKGLSIKPGTIYKSEKIQYNVDVEIIPKNDPELLINYTKQSAAEMFETTIDDPEKLKCFKKFVANKTSKPSKMIFCNVVWANRYIFLKKKTGSNDFSTIYYGHHILLLIPISETSDVDMEKFKQNIEKTLENSKGNEFCFTFNLLKEFTAHEKIWLSEVPCKMMVDFQHLFINSLEDLHKDTSITLNEKNVIPVYAFSTWWDIKKRINSKIAISAIKLGFISSEIMELLYHNLDYKSDEKDTVKASVEESFEEITEKIAKLCEDETPSHSKLYTFLFKYYTKFRNENDKGYFFDMEQKNVLKDLLKKLQKIKEKLEISKIVNEEWYDTILLEANEDGNEKINSGNFGSENSQNENGMQNYNGMNHLIRDKRRDKRRVCKDFRRLVPPITPPPPPPPSELQTQQNPPRKMMEQQKHGDVEENDFEIVEEISEVLPPSSSKCAENIQHLEASAQVSLIKRISEAEFSQIISIKPVLTKTELQITTPPAPPFTIVTPVPKRKPNYNIILIGESGSGKSTFVNAFQNYLKFSTLKEALNSESIECTIPIRFNIHTDTTSFENILIEYGTKTDDKNECFDDISASCTQQPKKYTVEYDDYNLTIIDTPGSSDTRGSTQDYENLNLIKSAVSKVEKIDAICLTILSNQTKLSTGFETRMKNLLSLFPSNPNIFFFFTNVGANHYYIGDAMTVIRQLILSYNSSYFSNIQINSSNVYSIENEGFRFLIAKKVGKNYTAQSEENCIKSWEHSAKEVQRFLATIKEQGRESVNNFDVPTSEIINNRF